MGDRQKKTELFDQLARVGKALGSGKRLELLDLLAQGERSVENLAAAAELGLSTASAHLQVLKQAGLVTTRKEATKVHYRLAGLDVARLYELMRTVATDRIADVERVRDDYLRSGRSSAPTADEEVTRDELLRRASAGTVIVVDVRPTEEYAAAHIPGALSIPLDDLARRIDELPADQEIVAYCRGAYCVLAYEAVDLLRASGRRARRLQDGMLEWRLTEMPIDSGRAA
ncbi:ArsR/SmtB family transcription factor [Rhodococcus chondri]|uniref:Metalloregulator ArsR/SmtB family transcription factor n=1 Tax=Rhodococcus chondri TaxID=3065941 RepID=A0ABU7JVG7_9NOCA|nr:metalloregulator ArsR/SmtB family transcription factor [Rhodococcus sp. CC-R104]MEE2034016.1 metalloregulator ArsR/SmtB family transcription factor [Rhodococcus sp. CC-R104]